MSNCYLDKMDELKADGIDFIPLSFVRNVPIASYTREEFKNVDIIPKTSYRFWKMVDGTKVYIDNNTDNMGNIKPEQLSALTKLIIAAASKQPNSQIIQEQDLLAMIAKVSNYETADKAKDLCDSKKHEYKFDTYLYWLSQLYNLLLLGIPSDKALNIISDCIDSRMTSSIYQQLGVIEKLQHKI